MSRAITARDDGPLVAVESWLEEGARRKGGSSWHLSRTPVVSLYPDFGELWWAGSDPDEAGIEKGVYRWGRCERCHHTIDEAG